MFLCCALRTGQNFGSSTLIAVLRGSKAKAILERGLEHQSTYGLWREMDPHLAQQLVEKLEESGYIRLTLGEYPIVKVTQKAKDLLSGEKKLYLSLPSRSWILLRRERSPWIPPVSGCLTSFGCCGGNWRRQPRCRPMWCSATPPLQEMARTRPVTKEQMGKISGVGTVKLERYGEFFLREIRSFQQQRYRKNR